MHLNECPFEVQLEYWGATNKLNKVVEAIFGSVVDIYLYYGLVAKRICVLTRGLGC